MKLHIAWIGRTKHPAIASLAADYLERISRYAAVDTVELSGEPALLKMLKKSSGRTPPHLVLLDSQGRQLTSQDFAEFLRQHQDRRTQPLLFAVGPADGFSDSARQAASSIISLGKMTLAHELARLVLLEQLYRAFTILKGHPYHTGH